MNSNYVNVLRDTMSTYSRSSIDSKIRLLCDELQCFSAYIFVTLSPGVFNVLKQLFLRGCETDTNFETQAIIMFIAIHPDRLCRDIESFNFSCIFFGLQYHGVGAVECCKEEMLAINEQLWNKQTRPTFGNTDYRSTHCTWVQVFCTVFL